MQQTLTDILKRLWQHINPRRRRQFGLLLVLTVITSFAEVVSLGAVLPFIGVLTQPDQVFASPLMSGIVRVMGFTSGAELVLPLTVGFALMAIIAGGLRLLLLWVSIRLSNATGADLSIEVYRRTLYQPYSVHLERSSSEIISGITQKVGTATGVLISSITVVTSAFLLLSIMITLLVVDPIVAIVAAAGFGAAYITIAMMTRHRLVRNSQCIAREQTLVVKALQEGLGAIRDVLLDGTQKVYGDVYRDAILKLQRANGQNSFINQAPRFGMESLGMALIAVFVLALSHRPGGIAAALPLLAMLALGAQRLLPLLQQLYGNWSVVAGSKAALKDVVEFLDQPLPADASQPEPEPLVLNGAIKIENVSFRYNGEGPWVLNGINLEIPKGSRIGLIGSTGSGKSTLLDIVMGLLKPSSGRIIVDGKHVGHEFRRAWQRTVAHVPQSIFLADATVAENIAFGVPPDQIDLERVRRAAERALIAEFIESRPQGYAAIVGERGIRLSGGQRQRIGIARALYKQANVIVFDEATSALDNDTERAVMEAIAGLGDELTILIVAHRLTTLINCTQVIELAEGSIKRSGTYSEIVNQPVESNENIREVEC